MSEATLLVIQGPEQGQRFEIWGDSCSIGRGGENDVRLSETEVSRRHARLSAESGRWLITDLQSANGTFVNGRAITSLSIEPGDQIQIGRTVLLFTTSAPRRPAAGAGERISLVARTEEDDQSRIVGQAPPFESTTQAGWTQAGANLQLLYQISEEAVRPTTSLDELLQRILDLTLRAVGADRGCMLVADSRTDRIAPRVVSHRPGVDVGERMPISTSIVEYVIQNAQGVRTSDAQHDSRFDGGQSIMKSGIREAMCVPMQGRYELMGVIYVDTTSTSLQARFRSVSQFNDQLLRLLLAIGRQSALAIENYRYRDALVTAERLAAVGQTIAILSHHIKNILQGIRGGGYLIDTGLRDMNEEQIRKGWGVVERNQERIYNLVMDMLTFSKERQPRLERANVEDVLKDLAELLQPRLTDTGITLTLTAASPMPLTLFDTEGMHRAVLNLLTNAIDALEGVAEPKIQVRYGCDRGQELLWIEIEDNGPGIEESELPRLFNLFESSKGAKGTGLGLAVSRKILQEHGGDITVQSRPGSGSCFRLAWPRMIDDAESSDDIDVRP